MNFHEILPQRTLIQRPVTQGIHQHHALGCGVSAGVQHAVSHRAGDREDGEGEGRRYKANWFDDTGIDRFESDQGGKVYIRLKKNTISAKINTVRSLRED